MTSEILISVIAIGILLIFSAFFSGSETALTAASRARMHRLNREGSRGAGFVERLISDRERLIGGILLGNNMVNILASALATSLFITLFGDAGVVYATLVMTALVLVFAEVLPKTYAIMNADRMSIVVAPLVNLFVTLLSPVVTGVRWIVRLTFRLFGVDIAASQNVLSPVEELRGAIDLQVHEGDIIKVDSDMLGSILDLSDVEVREVMIHRRDMLMIDASLPSSQIVEQVLESPYTRIPLWQDERENIIGILHAKDVLRAVHGHEGDLDTLDLQLITTEPWFVPETTTLREQLNEFRNRRSHFAVVVDEYGTLMGLVTLEDILEEIVGDIQDEHDLAVQGIIPQPDGHVNVRGSVTIRDLNRHFDWMLPDDEAATLAGLLINEARIIPSPGQQFSFYGFKFLVLRRVRNQITLISVLPPEKVSAAGG